jgi:hypothetical protein
MDSRYVGGLPECGRGRKKISKKQIRRTIVKTENQTKEARLEFFSGLYESAKNSFAETSRLYDRHVSQYKGDRGIDGSTESAITVRNVTYEIIESEISSDIPRPKVDASCFSEKRNRNARSVELLLSSIRDKLPYEEMNDIDERYTYIFGGSVWYVEWDNTVKTNKEVGCVRLYCLSPKNFIPQPGIAAVEDMEYCFLKFTTTRGELARKYGIAEDELDLAEYELCEECTGGETDAVTVISAFYKDEEGEVGKYIFSGGLTLFDMPRYYRRKIRVCKKCGKSESECSCGSKSFIEKDEPREILRHTVTLSDDTKIPAFSPVLRDGALVKSGDGYLMKETEVPYYTPRSFPIVIRKNTSFGDSLFGQSDCEYIRPEQQAINKIESRILQKLLRAGITPIMPEDASITLNNSVFGQVIKIKPGESAAQYGKVDTTPDISQDITEAERLYNHAKRLLGISDALQGLDAAINESGYARQLKISQAAGRLESKRKMKYTAYAHLDKLIFEQFLAFADEPRALIFRDAYGRVHNAEFNRYDFIEYDISTGEYYYDDAYLFSVDLNGGAEYQREALWERNLENLKAGTLGDPAQNMTLLRYWQCQERAHYPHARENVEYFKDAIEKEGGDRHEEATAAT